MIIIQEEFLREENTVATDCTTPPAQKRSPKKVM